jgi:protein CpxP
MTPSFRTFALVALTMLPALAQPAPRQRLREHRQARVALALNLTEAQKTSLKALREKHEAALTAKREALRDAQGALRKALQDPAASEAQLRPLHERASAARFELLLAARSLRLERRAILTPEQREKAAELRGAVQAHRQERRYRWGRAQ